jgi:hypothetical protein
MLMARRDDPTPGLHRERHEACDHRAGAAGPRTGELHLDAPIATHLTAWGDLAT